MSHISHSEPGRVGGSRANPEPRGFRRDDARLALFRSPHLLLQTVQTFQTVRPYVRVHALRVARHSARPPRRARRRVALRKRRRRARLRPERDCRRARNASSIDRPNANRGTFTFVRSLSVCFIGRFAFDVTYNTRAGRAWVVSQPSFRRAAAATGAPARRWKKADAAVRAFSVSSSGFVILRAHAQQALQLRLDAESAHRSQKLDRFFTAVTAVACGVTNASSPAARATPEFPTRRRRARRAERSAPATSPPSAAIVSASRIAWLNVPRSGAPRAPPGCALKHAARASGTPRKRRARWSVSPVGERRLVFRFRVCFRFPKARGKRAGAGSTSSAGRRSARGGAPRPRRETHRFVVPPRVCAATRPRAGRAQRPSRRRGGSRAGAASRSARIASSRRSTMNGVERKRQRRAHVRRGVPRRGGGVVVRVYALVTGRVVAVSGRGDDIVRVIVQARRPLRGCRIVPGGPGRFGTETPTRRPRGEPGRVPGDGRAR